MARKLIPAEKQGRYGRPERAHEVITADFQDDRLLARSCHLYGDAIGMAPEELLALARQRYSAHEKLVDKLLKHLPRKFEERVKALTEPRHEANRALEAVEIMLANTRHALAAGEAPPPEEPS